YSILLSILFLSLSACSMQQNSRQSAEQTAIKTVNTEELDKLSKAYFASGCFWCVEAIYESVRGVEEAVSGYSGGEIKNPTYQQVSSGRTKHAEAVEVYYDPEVVDYATLVKVFFGSHDPTTPNRQGPDRGPQYRSMVYYQNASEKQIVESYIQELEAAGTFDAKIVTEVVPFEVFYDAEDYHQDFERLNPNQPYVQAVSIPRLKRFQAKFPELLKEETH
ncbi:MAG: peptide-methionine (S)-S-oxide reductase MsrA, partial [Bacteroidota bacterium]